MAPAPTGSCHRGATPATCWLAPTALSVPRSSWSRMADGSLSRLGRPGQRRRIKRRFAGDQWVPRRGGNRACSDFLKRSKSGFDLTESSCSLCVQRTQNIFTFSFCQLHLSRLQVAAPPRAVHRLSELRAAPDGVGGSGEGGPQAPGLPTPAGALENTRSGRPGPGGLAASRTQISIAAVPAAAGQTQ